MPSVFIDDQEVEIGPDERLNGIEAAARAGVEIPKYCWHPGLSVVASCRMCLVESGQRNPETGEISMIPKLVPACQTPAKDNTVFVTNSEKVKNARAMVEEDLLLRHPVDCPICDKAGECSLQDYHFEHGRDERRADIQPFHSRRRPMGDTVTLFVDRCVMCSRCVRFCREVTGTGELMVKNRGSHEEIDVFPGYPLENKLSGNVVDLCPVGALGDKDFLYEQRVWFMESHDQVCAGCSTGCSINVEENQDQIYRLKPRENMHVNQWWMCDEGRYGWKHAHDDARLTTSQTRGPNGEHENMEWSPLLEKVDSELERAEKIAVVISPMLTVEEAHLLASLARKHDPNATLALGHVPIVGEDETFANGFTIHAEKCPNRRGVEEVIASFGGNTITWDSVQGSIAADDFDLVWITGGYPTAWASELETTATLIVQDIFDSPLWQRADYRLPGGVFAEREGSYVNHADRLQSFPWAIRPPAGVQVEGWVYWRLLQRQGLYKAKEVLEDLSREVTYFAAAAGQIPPTGVDLKVNQLA